MLHEAYCIAYRDRRWSVFHQGRDLGAFYLRTNALKFAVVSANRSGPSERHNVYVHDRNGDFYTVWDMTRDQITLDA